MRFCVPWISAILINKTSGSARIFAQISETLHHIADVEIMEKQMRDFLYFPPK